MADRESQKQRETIADYNAPIKDETTNSDYGNFPLVVKSIIFAIIALFLARILWTIYTGASLELGDLIGTLGKLIFIGLLIIVAIVVAVFGVPLV